MRKRKVLIGNDLPAEILRFAKFENVTQIVIGRSRGGFFAELFRRSLPHELIRRVDGHRDPSRDRPRRIVAVAAATSALPSSLDACCRLLWSTLAVAVAVLVGRAAEHGRRRCRTCRWSS